MPRKSPGHDSRMITYRTLPGSLKEAGLFRNPLIRLELLLFKSRHGK
jgi:hypothetical protein